MMKSIAIPLFGLRVNLIGCENNKISIMKDFAENMLLKDWKPKSIYKIPVTNIRKAKFSVIDMHAHDYIKSVEDVAKRSRFLDEVNVKKSVVIRLQVITNMGVG